MALCTIFCLKQLAFMSQQPKPYAKPCHDVTSLVWYQAVVAFWKYIIRYTSCSIPVDVKSVYWYLMNNCVLFRYLKTYFDQVFQVQLSYVSRSVLIRCNLMLAFMYIWLQVIDCMDQSLGFLAWTLYYGSCQIANIHIINRKL